MATAKRLQRLKVPPVRPGYLPLLCDHCGRRMGDRCPGVTVSYAWCGSCSRRSSDK